MLLAGTGVAVSRAETRSTPGGGWTAYCARAARCRHRPVPAAVKWAMTRASRRTPAALLAALIAAVLLATAGCTTGSTPPVEPAPTHVVDSASPAASPSPTEFPSPTPTESSPAPASPTRPAVAPPPARPPVHTNPPPPPPAPPLPPARGSVHPGAFCSPEGATGHTSAGTLMVCSKTATDHRLRWRSA